MANIKQNELPNIGKGFTIALESGEKLIIVIHFSGEREIFKFKKENGEPISITNLSDKEAHQVGAILTGAYFQPVVENNQS